VADRWRPLTPAEEPIADALARDASAIIRARFPGIDAQVTSGAVDLDTLTMVTAGMVKRAMVAPADGVTSQTDGMGPYSHAQTYANPLGNVFLTASDLVLIIGYQPAASSHGFANDTQLTTSDFGRVYGW
jgi:hypothetical protein